MATLKVYDALIIGGGPAGLSAALALARVRRTSILFDSGDYRNQGTQAMHSFLSRDGAHPDEFRGIARQQIQHTYSEQASFMKSKVVTVAKTEIIPGYKGFEVTDDSRQTFRGRKLILATGTEDILPTDLEGYKDNWPEHIYQCPFCDGYEHSSSPIAMLTFPNPAYAHLAIMLRSLNKSNKPLTIFTNGPIPSDDEPTQTALANLLSTASDIETDTRPITRLINNGPGAAGITLEFATGDPTTLGMLFHRPATRSRGHALIAQLGLETKTGTPEGEVVVVDPMILQTSLRGCFVAGDTHQMMKQVVVAAADGVRAAGGVVMQLCEEEMGKGGDV
ncbi:hypothetical protein F5144DRAFT_495733 [Chaetomium tenue]|uniref:Uncharacterized protein n=1 Tax=Chaetomium tenue TaxID=1854479 RepID=A0ACB7P042_9PEZI|nr:hypothetical protein F5144DRAFT_495733 [Chaetomium globosum]